MHHYPGVGAGQREINVANRRPRKTSRLKPLASLPWKVGRRPSYSRRPTASESGKETDPSENALSEKGNRQARPLSTGRGWIAWKNLSNEIV